MTHPHVPHPHQSLNDRIADRVGWLFGSMGAFWAFVGIYAAWMILADIGFWLFAGDRYPHPLLLFASNAVQLFALPVLGVIANRADRKRDLKADADHQALTYIAARVDAIEAAVHPRAAT